ncbi:hypothetical protein GBO17_23885 [Mycobacterium avium subsp. hominissuis]|uniref:hypothetical protein n=1 Tax=Mycobacterium avium TaxID=1764 RepID=UPI001CC6D714|nr:hypothetical protein [Mycobacterium avium]MBZ4571499.1 hypothetical protein [Mycobacterium avium subsp. hominissuis]MBZ4627766.1 hypothetical protein [Mycobacterium avium subsp. hominissuis]
MRDALVRLDEEFYWSIGPSQQFALEGALRKQESILRNLPVYPGYEWTKQASFYLYVDIECRGEDFRRKLDSSAYAVAMKVAITILNAVIEIAKRSGRAAISGGVSGD